MARAINKGPKPAGGWGKVSTTALQQAKEKQARRSASTPTCRRFRILRRSSRHHRLPFSRRSACICSHLP